MNMEPIIAPVDRELLHSELNSDRFLRKTNHGGNVIYVVNHHNSPNVMREIGRLRELAFRGAGGGTGLSMDIDANDTMKHCYDQLIVFDPETEEITGGYRYILGPDAYEAETDTYHLSTAHYFDFTDEFRKDYLPKAIELGRSWVNPDYQVSKNSRKGLFALSNLWDGLGALINGYPEMHYFFGKVTMYPNYNEDARNQLLRFMHYYFPDETGLVTPVNSMEVTVDEEVFMNIYSDLPYKEGMKVLQKNLKEFGEAVPPLIGIYMNISPSMKTFGTAINPDFGGVQETGIMVTIPDIYSTVTNRHS